MDPLRGRSYEIFLLDSFESKIFFLFLKGPIFFDPLDHFKVLNSSAMHILKISAFDGKCSKNVLVLFSVRELKFWDLMLLNAEIKLKIVMILRDLELLVVLLSFMHSRSRQENDSHNQKQNNRNMHKSIYLKKLFQEILD